MKLEKCKTPFAKYPPLGYMLRLDFEGNWLRVHNLHNGKRYPDNTTEFREVVKRNTAVFNETMSSPIVGLLTTFDLSLEELDNTWISSLNLIFFNKYDISMDDDPSYLVTTYSFTLNHLNEKMILDIANDEFDGEILFYSLSNKNIFTPYDGGIDLIIDSDLERIKLKKKFNAWCSQREDGL